MPEHHPAPDPPDGSRPVLEQMADHRSVRSFTDAPVSEATIARCVTAAQGAATSSWIQAYHLLQITDTGERRELAELSGGQAQVARAGAFFVVCGDLRRHRLLAERAGAAHVSNTETFLLAAVDASLFAQNLGLAFESEGLGVCYIGGLRNDLPSVDRLLEIPDGVLPLFGMAVGHPDDRSATRPRLPLPAVWSKDRYPSDDAMLAEIEAFDGTAAAHYQSRGLEGRTWSGGVWRKFARSLRPGLKAYYESKGARFE